MAERENEAILAFQPPPLAMLRLWLAPARAWHEPSFIGVERVDPSRPTMFVGNHTLYGMQDVPHIQYELKRVHGIFPRTLADRAHFALPVWRDLLTAFGCVNGTRENCTALMHAGQHLMLFPGGAREVFSARARPIGWSGKNGSASCSWRPLSATVSCRSPRSAQTNRCTSPWTQTTS